MERREFFIKGVGLLALPLVITEIGCDNSPTDSNNENNDNNDNTGNQDETFAITSSTSSGHTHTVELQYVNVNTPPSMNITLTSSATNHSHQITLTPDDYQTLLAGGTVVKTSTTVGGHNHTFNITVPVS